MRVHPGDELLHLGHHFRADPVAGEKKEIVGGHGVSLFDRHARALTRIIEILRSRRIAWSNPAIDVLSLPGSRTGARHWASAWRGRRPCDPGAPDSDRHGACHDQNHARQFLRGFPARPDHPHATPRTVTAGDVALYNALYGSRFALQSSDLFAAAIGYPRSPLDDLLVFHIVFGKTVPDISLNAVANLGYADCRFLHAVYPGDTLSATSEVIGLKENSSRKTGVVYVRSTGFKQDGAKVLEYVRWVMVRKRDEAAAAPGDLVPRLPKRSMPSDARRRLPADRRPPYDFALAGSPHRFGDYQVGEKIDHVDGMTVEEAEHQIATRLYQNTARVHFNQFAESKGRFGRRLIYGGHVISLARALSFNGLANAFHIAAINGGRHVAPLFAGGTVFAWSEVLAKAELPGRDDVGALRLRTVATKDQPCADFPLKAGRGRPSGRDPRSGLLGADAAVVANVSRAQLRPCFASARNRVLICANSPGGMKPYL